MNLKPLLFAFLLALFSPSMVMAIEPGEMLFDPVLEARAKELGMILRCVVCQNQPIEESNADLAGDMRVLVRDRIKNGDTDEEVLAYMVDRYGDFVLFNPPFKPSTYVLWIGPFAIAGIGLLTALSFFRRVKKDSNAAAMANAKDTPITPLNDKERKRLDALLKDDDA